MANESTNRSAEPFRGFGEKRPSTDRHESESELSKKARGSGDGEVWLAANVKKVAEILLVLATMVEMRGGRKATSVEVEMMIEARRKLVEICEVFGPKDVFENDVFGIIVDDLGLGRMKETKLAACCPKMSIGEKLEVTKVKMEEDEFYSPRAIEPLAASHGVRKSPSDKSDFQHHPTMAHASRVSDSVNLPSEYASPNSHPGKCSTVQHHLNLVQAPTHEEIAKIVQNIVNAHMPEPDHKTCTVPSTSDCMNKVLTCQTCQCVINEMCGAAICDACESARHLRCLQFNSKPISAEEWHCLKCVENSNGKPFPPKYGRVMRIASKPEMSSGTARVQQSIEKKVQSSDGNNNQKNMSSVRDALLNLLSQNGIKLKCNQEDDMREDEQDVEWVGDNFVKTSETCTVVEKNEGSVSSSMHDVEWVGDKLNEVDGKTYYRSCCINGTTYQLQQYAPPAKILCLVNYRRVANKKWVSVRRCFFPDDLPESVGRPCAPESNELCSQYNLGTAVHCHSLSVIV